MSDCVGACQQTPVLGVYDAGCKAVAHMEKHLPGVLQNRGRPTRLGDDGVGGGGSGQQRCRK
ncbi:expressed unknown protein [Ectocarpus siliculosus]|uniref:Uncharacterized protein n=1 Tax=Ectocarpus siliculosus TaxID=2880 RepID=D8LC86_ECTSI|nr:expressed unknown protein [Ectocarpus siliculosus]|eukprot:CBN78122.1 expressed unknown protein [Ectocarpus siliculosus]